MLFGNVFRFKLHQVMFQLLPGDKIQVDAYFSDGLEPRSLDYAPEKKTGWNQNSIQLKRKTIFRPPPFWV